MAWKAPWEPDPDPVRRRARDLDAEERKVADKLDLLRRQLEAIKNPPPSPPRETVWRAPAAAASGARPAPAVRREGRPERIHGAQRRRDRTRFILLALVLLVLIVWLIRRLF